MPPSGSIRASSCLAPGVSSRWRPPTPGRIPRRRPPEAPRPTRGKPAGLLRTRPECLIRAKLESPRLRNRLQARSPTHRPHEDGSRDRPSWGLWPATPGLRIITRSWAIDSKLSPNSPTNSADPARGLFGYVDTGPILERDLAQRAGLGFIGKHASLVSRRLGNWFFLAEILTTLELEPDLPETNHCGSCRRCLAACPTGALVAPFQLDARLCISYLTIELKGAIPAHLRPAIGNRIFGCDDCLAACPWNRFGREGRIMQASARSDLTTTSLIEWLGMDEARFKIRFAGTPMARAKRRGLLRNVCVALGNTAGPDALPALAKAAADPEPLIAEHARWAISELERRATRPSPPDSPGARICSRRPDSET